MYILFKAKVGLKFRVFDKKFPPPPAPTNNLVNSNSIYCYFIVEFLQMQKMSLPLSQFYSPFPPPGSLPF